MCWHCSLVLEITNWSIKGTKSTISRNLWKMETHKCQQVKCMWAVPKIHVVMTLSVVVYTFYFEPVTSTT